MFKTMMRVTGKLKLDIVSGHYVAMMVVLATIPTAAAELALQPGDHLCLVGNALGESLQHHPQWEAGLHQRFPKHQLVVRNLCFPGDEPALRRRIQNFGTPDEHLRHSRADAILFFFGLNESFRDPAGRQQFLEELESLVQHTKNQRYNGKSAPRIVLISPVAIEGRPETFWPREGKQNEILAQLTAEMHALAIRMEVGFADVFTPTRALFSSSDRPLTLNSIHLNDAGHEAFANILLNALFGPAQDSVAMNSALLPAVRDKNFHWWHRYRAVNGYSIYGERGEAGFDGRYHNRDVLEREREILDQMCELRDAWIWAIAEGRRLDHDVADSTTLNFLPVNPVISGNPAEAEATTAGKIRYLTADEQLRTFTLPDGFEINLYASEEMFPELANPVALNFDDRGRLWVAVMPSYPQWQPKSKLDDKLLILEDQDQDGQADSCYVFADGLHQPTGFELLGNVAFVACQPDLLELQDNNADGRADTVIRRLVGFCSADTHHGLGSLQWDPAGNLYLLEGLFKRTTLETPHGPQHNSDTAVWQWNPKSERARVHSSFPLTNPWGLVFDPFGQGFVANGTSGWHYWLTPISGRLMYPDKHAWEWTDDEDQRREYPQLVPHVARPCSAVEIVSSRNFPDEMQGDYLANNVIGVQGTVWYRLRDAEQGAGFAAEHTGELLVSSDPNFRPSHLQFGPDGALYVADWHNALIGHLQHNLRDPNRDHTHGRIWRIRYRHRPLVEALRLDGKNSAELLPILSAPELRTRYRVRRILAARPRLEVLSALDSFVAKASAQNQDQELLEALWIYQTHHEVQERLLSRLLDAEDFRIRAAATRVISDWHSQLSDATAMLRKMIGDQHPRVRVEAIRACSFLPGDIGMDVVLDALEHDTRDPHIAYVLEQSLRTLQAD